MARVEPGSVFAPPVLHLATPAPADTHPPRVLVFDSGVGGLSVLKEVAVALPGAAFTYVADDAGFPYGGWEEQALVARIVALMADLLSAHTPDVVVIACNTASTLVLPALRARFAVPFVGTVPAIKTAATVTRSGLVSVLATPGTVRRDYTRALIDTYASHVDVTLVGATGLAALAEAHLKGEPVADADVRREIAPAFVRRKGRRTDAVVLGCTHYPFLIDAYRRLAPWEVTWIDPAPAIARRVVEVLRDRFEMHASRTSGRAIFTSGERPPASLAAFLGSLRLEA